MTTLARLLRAEGLEGEIADRLAFFGEMLLEQNRTMNLTGAKTESALLPHLMDSLTLLPYVKGALVDIGSGGGLPAIPVAIAAGVDVTLVEATAKKAEFLASALGRLGIRGAVVNERAELAGRRSDLRDRFAFGSVRAVGGITTCAELVLCFLRPGGLALLQRGSVGQEDRVALSDAALVLGGMLEGVEAAGESRNLCLVRKTQPTPQRFPRRTGIPAKRPVCMKPRGPHDSLGHKPRDGGFV